MTRSAFLWIFAQNLHEFYLATCIFINSVLKGTSMYYVSTKGGGRGSAKCLHLLTARGHAYVIIIWKKMLNDLHYLSNLNKKSPISTQSRNWKELLFFSGRYKDLTIRNGCYKCDFVFFTFMNLQIVCPILWETYRISGLHCL